MTRSRPRPVTLGGAGVLRHHNFNIASGLQNCNPLAKIFLVDFAKTMANIELKGASLLKGLLEGQGLRFKDMADALGVSQASISRWIRRADGPPLSGERWWILAELLDIPVEDALNIWS